ncbi:MAG: ABC transporter permease [Actinomycetota bacterium]
MFFLTYLSKELRRRAGRTVMTGLGLALGVGLVATITSISDGLDEAQSRVLDPLSAVGTDLVVTRPVATEQAGDQRAAAVGPGGPGGLGIGPAAGAIAPEDRDALLQENSSVLTDLSKLGNPGDHFTHDFFLPATQLTFPEEQASKIASLDGAAAAGKGLTLLGVHQEGTVPQIVAELQTGGETINVDQPIIPPTEAERAQIEACIGRMQGSTETAPQPEIPVPGGGLGRAFRLDPEVVQKCFPERFARFRGSVTAPQRVIRQLLNPPQTDIRSETYSIAGVDLTTPGLGLITKAQTTKGSFFSGTADAKEAVLAEGYAGRKNLALGSEINLNGETYKVVGFVKPPLGGQAADVYLPLADLQRLSGRAGRINTVLVRAEDSAQVSSLGQRIQGSFEGAQVTSADDVAKRVSGSLVDAAKLADRLGLVLSLIVLGAAFLFASILTASSVARRVRELGTLKAIGWRTGRVVRQVLGESVVQGALGGLLGIALGAGAAWAIAQFAPPLEVRAAATSNPAGALFGLGAVGGSAASETVALSAPLSLPILALAVGLALLGGLIAGGVGGLRAARLRPADAMREIG